MIQSIFRTLLRLHPRQFRKRFEEEMLREQPTVRLVADALLSLVRQWIVRPQFLQESPAVAQGSGGVPQFFVFQDSRPHTSALIQGGLLSIILFTLIGLGLSHGEMPEVRSEFTGIRNMGAPIAAALQWVVPAPYRSRKTNLPPIPMAVSDLVLQSYAGVYVTDPPEYLRVYIRFERGSLRLAILGQFDTKLIPSSETSFVAAGGPVQSVEFRPDNNGHDMVASIFREGRVQTARRAEGRH